jgi:cyanophycinase
MRSGATSELRRKAVAISTSKCSPHEKETIMVRVLIRQISAMFLALFSCQAGWAIDNPLGMPSAAVRNGGSLVIGGGGSLSDDVYDEFVRLAGGSEARIVLIPSAYPYRNRDHMEQAFSGWRGYDVKSFDILHADSPEEANSSDFVKPLKKATGVWFAGGAQGRLAYRYVGTQADEAIQKVFKRGGAVGGTSAGASILSRTMICYGSSREAVVEGGLSLVCRAVIDQHFAERSRHTRLWDVISYCSHLLGIGIDEGTALIVQGGRLRVMGKGNVTLCAADEDNDPVTLTKLEDGDAVSLTFRDDRFAVVEDDK